MAVLDELAAGVPTIGAPDIERELALRHAAATAALFVVPGIAGLLLEPILFVLADRWPRRHFVRAGLAAMAAGAFLAATAPNAAWLAIAIALWAVATGTASALAQATLVDAAPDRRARTMARWTLLSLAGDLGGPLVLGVLAAGERGWRTAFALVGGALAVWALIATMAPFPEAPPADADEPSPGVRAAIRDALRDRALLAWLLATALCDLLDEIFVVFASLHVRHDLGAGATWQSVTIGAFVAGGAIGLAVLDRILAKGHAERRVLVATSIACAIAYAAWLAAPVPWLAAALAMPVGIAAAPMYPLAAARAYALRPGRSSSVLVASHLFTPFGLALPWLLGLLADALGIWPALAFLLVQPVGLALLSVQEVRDPGGGGAGASSGGE